MNKNFSFTKPHKSDYKTYRVYVKSFGKEKPQGFRPGIQAEILAEIWLRTQMFDIENSRRVSFCRMTSLLYTSCIWICLYSSVSEIRMQFGVSTYCCFPFMTSVPFS